MLFRRFAERLTRWITCHMYEKFRDNRDNYNLTRSADGSGSYQVSHKISQDVHEVSNNFECTYDGNKPCWQQKYAGCVCVHGLIVCVHRLSCLQLDKDEQEKICDDAILACNQNWHRNMYAGSLECSFSPPPAVTNHDLFRPEHSVNTLSKLKARFVNLAAYMPIRDVEKFLFQLKECGLSRRGAATNSPQHTSPAPTPCPVVYHVAVVHVVPRVHVALHVHVTLDEGVDEP